MIKPIQKSILMSKPHPLPKGLIYYSKENGEYRLIDMTAKKFVGKMFAADIDTEYDDFYKLNPGQKIFHIFTLEIDELHKNKGWGSYLVDFAKKESYKRNCEGRLSLISYNYDNPPHAFYKKQGLVTTDEKVNKELDDCIKYGVRSCTREALSMYLPNVAPIKVYQNPKPSSTGELSFWGYLKKIFWKK